MEDFFLELQDPGSWTSLLLAGILINILSSLLERGVASFSQSRRKRIDEDESMKKGAIAIAIENDIFYDDNKFIVLLFTIVFFSFFILSATLDYMLLRLLLLAASFYVIRRWMWHLDVVSEARSERNKVLLESLEAGSVSEEGLENDA